MSNNDDNKEVKIITATVVAIRPPNGMSIFEYDRDLKISGG